MSDPIDLEVAVERLGGDRELLRELAGMFVEDAAEAIGRYRERLAADDWPQAKRAVHSLKGLFGLVEANAGVAIASELEQDAIARTPSATGRVDALQDEYDRVVVALREQLEL